MPSTVPRLSETYVIFKLLQLYGYVSKPEDFIVNTKSIRSDKYPAELWKQLYLTYVNN